MVKRIRSSGKEVNVSLTVHVKVHVVKLRDLVLLQHLTEARVALRDPSVELRHPHPKTCHYIILNIFWHISFYMPKRRKLKRRKLKRHKLKRR